MEEVVGCVGFEEAVSVAWEGHVAFVGWGNALDGREEDFLPPLQNVVPFNDVFLFPIIDSGLSSNPSNHPSNCFLPRQIPHLSPNHGGLGTEKKINKTPHIVVAGVFAHCSRN